MVINNQYVLFRTTFNVVVLFTLISQKCLRFQIPQQVHPQFQCKGTVIGPSSKAKIAMNDSQCYPLNLYLIFNVGDIVVFLGLKGFNIKRV